MTTLDDLRRHVDLGARCGLDDVPRSDVDRQERTALQALARLETQPGIVLADEVGMGKTFEALAVIAYRLSTDPTRKAVIITPGPDLNKKWEKEIARFQYDKGMHPIGRFGTVPAAVTHVRDFLAKVRASNLVVAPISIFSAVRAGDDQAQFLTLFARWKRLPHQTVTALFRRFRDGQLEPMRDLEERPILGGLSLAEVEPHLPAAFEDIGLLYDEHGVDAFAHKDIRRKLDRARFRLLGAFLPDLDLLVVDEAHKLKNEDTVRAQAVADVFGGRFSKALFLTATPFQLGIQELRQVLGLFGRARNPGVDMAKETDHLVSAIERYQAAYDRFERTWCRLDPEVAMDLRAAYDRHGAIAGDDLTADATAVRDAVAELVQLKKDVIEPALRRWMVRSLRPHKRAYRRQELRREKPDGAARLPFLVYERFIAELFRKKDPTHKAAVEINMVSSFDAAREGQLLVGDRESMPASARPYRKLLRDVLGTMGSGAPHPKLDAVLADAVEAAGRGEKTLIFCSRVQTLEALSKRIQDVWREHVLARWREVLPGVTHEAVFSSEARGLPQLLRDRFHDTTDALYVALRENYLRTVFQDAQRWAEGHEEAIAQLATEKLRTLRTGTTSAERIDWQLLKRCVDQATLDLWAAVSPEEASSVEADLQPVRGPEFLDLGFDLVRDELEEGDGTRGDRTPTWSVSTDAAQLTIATVGLWGYLTGELFGVDREVRVRVGERIARFLTSADVTFLPDVLRFARDEGLDLSGRVESRVLLRHLERFWRSPAGRGWLERVKAFLQYFASRDREEQMNVAESLGKGRVRFARHTAEGDTREMLREAFNTPFYPMVLVVNEVMQEGLDLHRSCRRVVHHDLSWNPAQLEQRVGRVDRLGSRTEKLRVKNPDAKLEILVPLIERTIDDRLYRTVKTREKWLEFLLGAPPKVGEASFEGEASVPLPERLTEELRVNLAPI